MFEAKKSYGLNALVVEPENTLSNLVDRMTCKMWLTLSHVGRKLKAMKNTCISNPDGDNHSNRKMDNADAWRATIPISSHDFPSNGSYKNLFPQLIGSLENGFGYYLQIHIFKIIF